MIRGHIATVRSTLFPAVLLAAAVMPAVCAPAGPTATPANEGARCLVCAAPVGAQDLTLQHRGRDVTLHRGHCLEEWEADPARYFSALQPRGALFQEPAAPPSPLRRAWFLVGSYIVLGLFAGALCGYVAIGRGLPPLSWFFAGLAANVFALVFLMTRRRGDPADAPEGIPRGLAKVPTTRNPAACPSCGADNHPAARECSRCHRALTPQVESEAQRAWD